MSVDENFEEVPASLQLEPNPFEQSFASQSHNSGARQASPPQVPPQPLKHELSSVSSSFATQPATQATSTPVSAHSHATSRTASTQTSSYGGPPSRNRSHNNLQGHQQAVPAPNQHPSTGMTPLAVSPGQSGVWLPSHISGPGSMGPVVPPSMQRSANTNIPAAVTANPGLHNGVAAAGLQSHLLPSPGIAMMPGVPLMASPAQVQAQQQQAQSQAQQQAQQLSHIPGLAETNSNANNLLPNAGSSSQAPSMAANGLYMLSQPNTGLRHQTEDDSKNNRRKRSKPDKHDSMGDDTGRQANNKAQSQSHDTATGEDAKRQQFLERNRVAAVKCRQRKKQFVENLKSKTDALQANNVVLNSAVIRLQSSVDILRDYILKNVDVRQAPHQVMAILNPSLSQQQHQQLPIPPQQQQQPQQQQIQPENPNTNSLGGVQAQSHQMQPHVSSQGQVPKNVSAQMHGNMTGMPGMPPGVILPQN